MSKVFEAWVVDRKTLQKRESFLLRGPAEVAFMSAGKFLRSLGATSIEALNSEGQGLLIQDPFFSVAVVFPKMYLMGGDRKPLSPEDSKTELYSFLTPIEE